MIDQFSIENMKAELARASNKADEDAKTIAELIDFAQQVLDIKNPKDVIKARNKASLLLTNNKPKIDFPLLLQDEAE